MFRGINFPIGTMQLLLLLGLAFGSNGQVLGQSADRQKGDEVTGKLAAPSLEDHAAYFNESQDGNNIETKKKADVLRLKTLSSIESLLKSKKKSVRRFELLLRLGELHVERHDFLRDLEMTEFGDAYDKWEKLPADKRGQEPKLNTSRSQAELIRGANAFRKLVTEYPKHQRSDAAFYSLAKTLGRLGKSTAPDYYKQLIQKHPKSPLIPDAYLALGEYYFDLHKVDEALGFYKKVLDFKEHKAYPYAIYKLGWAYYNATAKNDAETQANYKKAVTAFKLVVKLSEKDQNRTIRKLDLKKEAIRDLIMVWADAEDVQSAWTYFKTIGDNDSFYKMLERLGNIYAEQGKNEKALAVYERILKETPTRSNNPTIHSRTIELYDLENKITEAVANILEMQSLYLGATSWTAQVQKTEPDLVAETEKLVENTMHRYGAIFHNRGQKSKSKAYLKQAAIVYDAYIKSFAKHANAYDIRYYLAEILYDFKEFEAASGHYMVVAKQDAAGKYHKSAALNAVACMNQMVQDKTWAKLPPAGQVPTAIEIPSEKQKFVVVIDEYVKLLPAEKDGYAMRFTAAQTYFDYGHYPEALKRFEAITVEIPETKQAQSAVKLILGFHADRQDWSNLIAAARRFKGGEKLLTADLQKYVVDLLRGAMFKRALAFESAKNYEKAADDFVDYQKEFPTDSNADRALYNASLNFYKVGLVDKAIAANTRMLEQYPKSSLRADVMANLSQTFESLARFEKAAEMYRRFADSYPKDQRAADALYNSAVLYKGVQNFDMAAAVLGDFLKRYSDHKLASTAATEMAKLHERAKNFSEAVAAYQGIAKRFGSDKEMALFAEAKAAAITTLHLSAKKGALELEQVRRSLVDKAAPNAFEARQIVAGTLFKILEPQFGEYRSLPVQGGKDIEKQVQTKQAGLVALAEGYQDIIAIGNGEFVVASLFRLGEAHENFAGALFKAPGPSGASQAELDRFRTELEKVAFPLRDEANNFFDTAYKRSKEVQTFTDWTAKAYKKMVEMNPEKYASVNALTADAEYLGHNLKMTKEIAELWE